MANAGILPPKKKKDPLANDGIPRAILGRELQRRIDHFKLSREMTGKILDDAASQMSRLMTGHFEEFSADRLVKFLLRLGTDVEVRLIHRRSRKRRPSVRVLDASNGRPVKLRDRR